MLFAIIRLTRIRVSLAVTIGALFGALYYGRTETWNGVLAALGAGMLCAACSALNQVQEREFDALMVRTQSRPLVSGKLSVKSALLVAAVFGAASLALFFLVGGWSLFALGVLIPIVYNGLYTPLKQVTPMALLVGALSGALPPLIGWIGAGGSFHNPSILAVTGLFYLWQVPHFWLLHEKHREDYQRAGFATLDMRLPHHMYKPLLVLWVGAYFLGLGCLAFTSGAGMVSWLLPVVVLMAGAWTVYAVIADLRRGAAAAIYGSLPVGLVALLSTTF